jgi:hypothetical protein
MLTDIFNYFPKRAEKNIGIFPEDNPQSLRTTLHHP